MRLMAHRLLHTHWWVTTPLLGAAITGAVLFWQTNHAMSASENTSRPQLQADWERRWIRPLDPNICSTDPAATSRFVDPDAENAFHIAGGTVDLQLDGVTGHVHGTWILEQVEAPWGWLHLQPPAGFSLHSATAMQTSLPIDASHPNHLAIA